MAARVSPRGLAFVADWLRLEGGKLRWDASLSVEQDVATPHVTNYLEVLEGVSIRSVALWNFHLPGIEDPEAARMYGGWAAVAETEAGEAAPAPLEPWFKAVQVAPLSLIHI